MKSNTKQIWFWTAFPYTFLLTSHYYGQEVYCPIKEKSIPKYYADINKNITVLNSNLDIYSSLTNHTHFTILTYHSAALIIINYASSAI